MLPDGFKGDWRTQDAAINLWQGHIHGHIARAKPPGAVLPVGLRTGGMDTLNDRHIQARKGLNRKIFSRFGNGKTRRGNDRANA